MDKIKNTLIIFLHTCSLCVILLHMIGLIPDLLIVLISTIICVILFFNMYTLTFTLVFALCVGYDIYTTSEYIIYNHISALNSYLTGQVAENYTVTTMISIIIIAVIVIISTTALMNKKSSVILIILSFCIVLMSLIFGENISGTIQYYILWLFSELILVWRHMAKAYTWKMIPVCISCVLIAFVIPNMSFKNITSHISPIMDIPMKWIDNKVYAITGPRFFSMEQYGYNSELGGDIDLTDDPVMAVKTVLPLYLTGAAYDIYTGTSWESSGNDTWLPDGNDAESVEFLERIASNILLSYAMGELNSFAELLSKNENGYKNALLMPMKAYYKPKAEITLLDRTFVLYTPQLTIDLSNEDYYINARDNIISDKLLTDGMTYAVTYRTNGTVSYWESIMDKSYHGVLSDINAKVKDLRKTYNFSPEQEAIMLIDGPEPNLNLHYLFTYPENEKPYAEGEAIPYETLLEETLIPYSERIHEQYTQLPDVYPERIKALTQDIIANLENDYSRASAIMRYLRQFPYTLNPGEPDPKKDFVDQFLFDGQQGYCQYFATAFVIMCRTVDIPARYTEGFYTSGKRTDGVYTVTKKHAHAWAEVYLEGYGWVIFDPTSSSETLSPSRGYLGEILSDHLAGKYDTAGDEYEPVDIISDINVQNTPMPKRLGLYIILPLLFLIAVKLLSQNRRNIFYRIMPPERFIKWSVKYLRKRLRKNKKKLSYNTLRQEFTTDVGVIPIVEEIISIYEKYIYGSYNLTIEDKRIVNNNLYLISKESPL